MDNTARAYSNMLERSNAFVDYFTTGMEGDDWLKTPAGVPNPAIWILGHLAHSRAALVEVLTGESVCEEGWADLFEVGTDPRDPKTYPSVDRCRTVLGARMADVKAYLETASQEDLDRPPCTGSEYYKSKAAALTHLIAHEAHHTGALSLIRRLLGKDRLI